MTKFLTRGGSAFALFAAIAVLASGCGKDQPVGETKGSEKDRPVAKNDGYKGHDPKDPPKADPKDDHSGWWCNEHALPEDVCDLCHKKYRESEKAKGNWCEHNRVKTSCFKCNPGLKEKYAAEYKAKFSKDPPPTEEEEEKKKEEGKKDKK